MSEEGRSSQYKLRHMLNFGDHLRTGSFNMTRPFFIYIYNYTLVSRIYIFMTENYLIVFEELRLKFEFEYML